MEIWVYGNTFQVQLSSNIGSNTKISFTSPNPNESAYTLSIMGSEAHGVLISKTEQKRLRESSTVFPLKDDSIRFSISGTDIELCFSRGLLFLIYYFNSGPKYTLVQPPEDHSSYSHSFSVRTIQLFRPDSVHEKFHKPRVSFMDLVSSPKEIADELHRFADKIVIPIRGYCGFTRPAIDNPSKIFVEFRLANY